MHLGKWGPRKFTVFQTFFVVAMAFALLVTAHVLWRRMAFEQQNHLVELVVSYREMRQMAHLNGMPLSELLPKLKASSGVVSVAIEEETVADFIADGKATLLQGAQILDMYRVGAIVQRSVVTFLYSEYRVDPRRYYFIVEQKDDFERLRRCLAAEFGSARVRSLDLYNVVEVLDEYDDLMMIGLGIPEDAVAVVKDAGFGVIPRLSNTNRLSEEVVRQKLLSLRAVDFVNTVIFDGTSVLGYPSFIPLMAERLSYLGINIGLVEFLNQTGIYELASHMPTSTLRVHSMMEGEIEKLSTDQVISRYVRAAKERGHVILFLKPYKIPKDQSFRSVVDYNIGYFAQVHEALVASGFTVGKVRQLPLGAYSPIETYEWVILSFGVLACVLALVNVFRPVGTWLVVCVAGCWILLAYVMIMAQMEFFWVKLLALMIACVMPALAVVTQYPHTEGEAPAVSARMGRAVLFAVKVAGIALAGGLFIAALLSDSQFLLGIDQFYGVKISFVFPLIVIGVFFFLRPHRISAFLYVFRRLFMAPVRTSFLVAAVFCAVFMLVYVLRSGNAGSAGAPMYETWVREGLETLLMVRPRTKEFLIGYPFLMMGVFYGCRPFFQHWVWFFNVLGAVALVSVVNSFCHVHTPVTISILRSVLGVSFGVFCGIGYVAVFFFLKRIMRRFL